MPAKEKTEADRHADAVRQGAQREPRPRHRLQQDHDRGVRWASGPGAPSTDRAAGRPRPAGEGGISSLFLFVGADPATEWLRGCGMLLDAKGFVAIGAARHMGGEGDADGQLETIAPGVFAVGDVRSGSVKRVGGAIGEGAAVVARLRRHLAA